MFKIIISLLFIYQISCAEVKQSNTGKITSEFIKALNARDLNQDFVEIKTHEEEEPTITSKIPEKCFISAIPNELMGKIFEYIDYEDSKSFIEVSKAFEFFAKIWINNRLRRFCRHFMLENNPLNHFVACELSHYFKTETRLIDGDVYDQFEIACVKHIIQSNEDEISNLSIKYLAQAFIHESLYGSDSPIPVSVYEWKAFLLMKLSEKNNIYTMALDLYVTINRKLIDEEYKDISDRLLLYEYLDLFVNFVKSSCTWDDLQRFEEQKSLLNMEPKHLESSFEKEVQLFTQLNFHEYLVSDEDAFEFLIKIYSNGLYSKSLYDRVLKDSEIAFNLNQNQELQSNRMLKKHYYDKWVNPNCYCHHLWSRNPKKPVTRQQLLEYNFESLVATSSPSLILLDSLVKSIKANLLDFRTLQSIEMSLVRIAYQKGHNVIFDIIMNNLPNQKINVFYQTNYPYEFRNIFNIGALKRIKFNIYLKYLISQGDPLPLIFLNPNVLFDFKDSIVNKFSLNKHYDLKFAYEDLKIRKLNTLYHYQNQKLCFGEIIKILNNQIPGLIEVFTSRPISECILESGDSDQLISVRNFIFFAWN